jgi:mannose-6-phosphate isomerase
MAALIIAEDLPADEAQPYLARAVQGAAGLWGYLETDIAGLWRDKRRTDGGYEIEPAPASSLYHIVGAVISLMAFRDRAAG